MHTLARACLGKLDIYTHTHIYNIYIYFENSVGLTRNDRGGEGRKGIGWIRFGKRATCRNNVRVFDLRHVTEPH